MWVSVLQAESNMATPEGGEKKKTVPASSQKCVWTLNTHPWISVHTYMQAASTDERTSQYDHHFSQGLSKPKITFSDLVSDSFDIFKCFIFSKMSDLKRKWKIESRE